jgi:elongation factor P
MTKAGNLPKGKFVLWRGEPREIIKRTKAHHGRGSAQARLWMKGLVSGNTIQEGFNVDEELEEIDISFRSGQYLYRQGDSYVFMDQKDYQQYEVDKKIVGQAKDYLVEGETYQIGLYDGEVISVRLPQKVTLEVKQTSAGVKGNTVSGATKPAVLETGLTVKVPLFIKQGEKIIVNTDSGEYVSRA